MFQRTPILLVVAALACLAAVPAAGSILGTPEDPELQDSSNDVSYDATYVGPHDMDYLDITSAWFEFNETDDLVNFTLRVKDAQALADPPEDYRIRCSIEGDLAVGDADSGVITFNWLSQGNGEPVVANVTYHESSGDGVNAYELTPIPHTFNLSANAPGDFAYSMERNALLHYGEVIDELRGWCSATQWAPGGFVTTGAGGSDDARGSKAYDLTSLGPSPATSGSEAGPGNGTNHTDAGERETPVEEGAVGLSAPIILVAVASAGMLAVYLRRRH